MAANIKPKNNQDAFDKVLKAIRLQNYIQSQDPLTEACWYRGPDGLRCAAGHLLPNNLYRKSMEGKTIGALFLNFSNIRDYFHNVNDMLLSDLQSAHDSNLAHGAQAWENRMKQIATYYNLVYTDPCKG